MKYMIDHHSENTRSTDLDYNSKKPALETGFLKDNKGFYEVGEYERKDTWGEAVTHQDNRSRPKSDMNYCY